MNRASMLAMLEAHAERWTDAEASALPSTWGAAVVEGSLTLATNPFTGESWVPDQLELLPESSRYEIADGTLIIHEHPHALHQMVTDHVVEVLGQQTGPEHTAARSIGVELHNARFSADVCLARRDAIQWHSSYQRAAAVTMIVEVVSPSTATLDRLIKAEKYAAAGIPGYWRVELDPLIVIAYALRDGTYVELGRWCVGETVEVDDPVQVSFDPAILLP